MDQEKADFREWGTHSTPLSWVLCRAEGRELLIVTLFLCFQLSAYHHGEVSLQGTIVNLAQNYVGSNNINLLLPIGQILFILFFHWPDMLSVREFRNSYLLVDRKFIHFLVLMSFFTDQ
jgi:hypothetical protein